MNKKELEVNKVKVRNELVQAAKYKKQVEYLTLSYLIGLETEDREAVNELLMAGSVDELKDGKPILWPLVVEEEAGLPCEEYFKLVEKLDIYPDVTDKQEIYDKGLEEVFAYWSKRKKTGKSGTRRF